MKRLYWACRYWVLHNKLLKRFLRLQRYQLLEHDNIVAEVKESRRKLTGELGEVIWRLSTISDNLETVLEDMRDKDKND